MTDKEYQKFAKRYDKFKNNNLPTPFWDEERLTLEYVYNTKVKENNTIKDSLKIDSSLTAALSDIALTGLYYPFIAKVVTKRLENNQVITETVIESTHAHSFEEVVKHLYESPQYFKISKEDQIYYSKQELEYLRKVQNYLLLIKIEDSKQLNRYQNKLHTKYSNSFIYSLNDNILNKILTNQINYLATKCPLNYEINLKNKQQALITDKLDNFKLFIEFTSEEIKLYREIKSNYLINNLNDTDKVLIKYFKILEKFN